MTNEQIKQTLDNAPEGATHVDAELDYWKALSENECILMSTVYSSTIGQQYPLRSLADLREILQLRELVEKLDNEVNQALLDADKERIRAEKAHEFSQRQLIHVGYTNGNQLYYAKNDSEGAFYPDTENDCYIPLYMLGCHLHRIETTFDEDATKQLLTQLTTNGGE